MPVCVVATSASRSNGKPWHHEVILTPIPRLKGDNDMVLKWSDGTWHNPTDDQYDLLTFARVQNKEVHAKSDSQGAEWNAYTKKEGNLWVYYSHEDMLMNVQRKKSVVYSATELLSLEK